MGQFRITDQAGLYLALGLAVIAGTLAILNYGPKPQSLCVCEQPVKNKGSSGVFLTKKR